MPHVGIEKDVIRADRIGPEFRPGLGHVEADGRQLPHQGVDGRMGPVKDCHPCAAEIRNPYRPPHDTTRSFAPVPIWVERVR